MKAGMTLEDYTNLFVYIYNHGMETLIALNDDMATKKFGASRGYYGGDALDNYHQTLLGKNNCRNPQGVYDYKYEINFSIDRHFKELIAGKHGRTLLTYLRYFIKRLKIENKPLNGNCVQKYLDILEKLEELGITGISLVHGGSNEFQYKCDLKYEKDKAITKLVGPAGYHFEYLHVKSQDAGTHRVQQWPSKPTPPWLVCVKKDALYPDSDELTLITKSLLINHADIPVSEFEGFTVPKEVMELIRKIPQE